MKQILNKLNWISVAKVMFAFALVVIPVAVPQVASAQNLIDDLVGNCPADAGVRCNEGSVADIFKLIISWALALGFIAAVIILIYGGFLYITSAGNADQAGKGKTAIFNALIGIVIIVMSYMIVQIVFRFVTGDGAATTGTGA